LADTYNKLENYLGCYRTLEIAQELLVALPRLDQKVGWKEEIQSKMQENSKKIPGSVTLLTINKQIKTQISSVPTEILSVIFTFITVPDLLNARK
jgi:hypothetical protein